MSIISQFKQKTRTLTHSEHSLSHLGDKSPSAKGAGGEVGGEDGEVDSDH